MDHTTDNKRNPENLDRDPLVLAVDDEPIALDLSLTVLKRNGFQTIAARNGREALKLVEEYHPDLVLLDFTMPDMDGFEVFEKLRSNPEFTALPVIFVTARDDLEHRVKGLELGAVDYITKPYNLNELVARVRSTLRMRNLERQLVERQKNDIRKDTVKQLFITMAHYINNANAAIQGRTAITPPDDVENVKILIDLVKRQSKVIEATVLAIETMSERLTLKTTDYADLHDGMLDVEPLIKEILSRKGIDI